MFHRSDRNINTIRIIVPVRIGIAVLLALVALFANGLLRPVSAGSPQQAGPAGGGQARRFSMTYVYFGNSALYTSLVDNAQGALDHVAPSYFDLNKDGTLKFTQAIDRDFIDAMHERGISVTPFLSNHWDPDIGINALENRERLAVQIADAVKEYGLDGVNVDIENMTEKERDKYTDFVRILRQKLPASPFQWLLQSTRTGGLTDGLPRMIMPRFRSTAIT